MFEKQISLSIEERILLESLVGYTVVKHKKDLKEIKLDQEAEKPCVSKEAAGGMIELIESRIQHLSSIETKLMRS